MGAKKAEAQAETYTERQAAQLASLDAEIETAKKTLQDAQDAQRAADAAMDPQGIANARAAENAARTALKKLNEMRTAAARLPAPKRDDGWSGEARAMEAAWNDRVEKIQSEIVNLDSRLADVSGQLAAMTDAADVAKAAELAAAAESLKAQKAAAIAMLERAQALPKYDIEKLNGLFSAEDERIKGEWDAAVARFEIAVDIYKDAWRDLQRVRSDQGRVAVTFGGMIKESNEPDTRFKFEHAQCWENTDTILRLQLHDRWCHPGRVLGSSNALQYTR